MTNQPISRDVTCPFCHAAPRQNCQNMEMPAGRGDMGRMCHNVRFVAARLELERRFRTISAGLEVN